MKTVNKFIKMKQSHEKITLVTCYDYTSAIIAEQSNIDCILVGDSAAMVMHGAPDTTHATLEMISTHVSAVAKGIKTKFIIADLPFMSYRKSLSKTISAVETLIRCGAHAVKLEGVTGNIEAISHIVDSGIPVMGHIGLTPQHIHALGGFKIQGKSIAAQQALLEQAIQLEQAGCFSIVLECIPADLAAQISLSLSIPTIGIGAGWDTDGQVLVMHDLLGLNPNFKPKFVKEYLNGSSLMINGINQYVTDVKNITFPNKEYAYSGSVHANHS